MKTRPTRPGTDNSYARALLDEADGRDPGADGPPRHDGGWRLGGGGVWVREQSAMEAT